MVVPLERVETQARGRAFFQSQTVEHAVAMAEKEAGEGMVLEARAAAEAQASVFICIIPVQAIGLAPSWEIVFLFRQLPEAEARVDPVMPTPAPGELPAARAVSTTTSTDPLDAN